MGQMRQTDLIQLIAADTDMRYEAVRKVIRKMNKYLSIAFKNGDGVHLGIGTFTVKKTGKRQAQNFKTGERYNIPEGLKVDYKPSKFVKTALSSNKEEIMKVLE
jgi:DNA-binding protein HU-beta